MQNEYKFNEIENKHAVDYSIRTIQQIQVQYSQMADVKAHIMITVCSVMISLTLTNIDDPMLGLPLSILICFALVALVLATLTIIPGSSSKFSKISPESQAFNPLFFMHFSNMKKEDYVKFMEKKVLEENELYEILFSDIYSQGSFLVSNKYRYLRWSYIVFLSGFCISIILLLLKLYVF